MEQDKLEAYLLPNVEGLEEGDKDVDELDSGAYGIVFKVSVNGLPCMAKKIHRILSSKAVPEVDRKSIRQKFRNECLILSRLSHPNIVRFVGVFYGKSRDDLILVMEKLRCDLATFVEKYKNIPNTVKFSILLDVSYGLLYLHTQNPPIIHRDLTAPNVLLTNDCHAKIADLGVSKVLTDPRMIKQTTAPGNASYMAPEAKVENPRYGTSMDIFSFGHLVIHISIQEWPKTFRVMNPHTVEPGKLEIAERKQALERMKKRHPLYQIATGCLHDEPRNRPSTEELNKMISHLTTRYPKSISDLIPLHENSKQFQLQEDFKKESMDQAGRFDDEEANEIQQIREELNECKKALEQEQRKTIALQCDGSEQQLDASIADTARLHDEVLAKTAQVLQYKKQIDSYTVKLEEAQNDIAQTQQSWESLEDQYKARLGDLNSKLQHKHLELRQCQEQLKTMEDDKEYEIQKANVSFEANKLLGETKLVQAQREISSLKVELRQWKTKLFDEGQVSEMLSIEFEKGKKLEEQLAAAQAKCCKLFDRCDVRYKAIETLQQTLKDNGVKIPRINIGLPEIVYKNSPQRHAAFSPTLSDQESLSQRQLAPKQQHQCCDQHIPPTSRAQTQQPAEPYYYGHRIDTGPPFRAKDLRIQELDYDQHHQGGPQPHPDYTNREEYYRADQQENQRWANQGGYSPSPHRPPHIPQYPPSDQQGYPPNPTPTTQDFHEAANAPQSAALDTQLPSSHVQPSQPTQWDQEGSAPQRPIPRRTSNNSFSGKNTSSSAERRKQQSKVQENVLLEGIDRDIKEAAELVTQEGEVMKSMAPEAPFDPNLVCYLCSKSFRVGEIQKYRKHVERCADQKKKEEEQPLPQSKTEWNVMIAGGTEPMALKVETSAKQQIEKESEHVVHTDRRWMCRRCRKDFSNDFQKFIEHSAECEALRKK